MRGAQEQSGARPLWIALGAAAPLGDRAHAWPELYRVAIDPDEHEDLDARPPARVAEMVQRLEQRLAEQNGRFRFAAEAMLVASGGFERLDDETRKTWRASAR